MRTYTMREIRFVGKASNKLEVNRADWTGCDLSAGAAIAKLDKRIACSAVLAKEPLGETGRFELVALEDITFKKGDLLGVVLNLIESGKTVQKSRAFESLNQLGGPDVGTFERADFAKIRAEKVEETDYEADGRKALVARMIGDYWDLYGDTKMVSRKINGRLKKMKKHTTPECLPSVVRSRVAAYAKARKAKADNKAKEAGKNRTILRVNSADAKQPIANK